MSVSIPGLVFDFDGLIIETEKADFLSWQEIFADYGLALRLEDWDDNIGGGSRTQNPYDMLERHLGRAVDRDAIRARRRERYYEIACKEKILPGVVELLEAAKRRGNPLAIASNSYRWWLDRHLERLNLRHFFGCVCSGDEVSAGKPAPDLYLAAVRALNLAPSDAIALEDSPKGIAAAKAAGLFCVAVPTDMTRSLDLGAADLIIGSLAEITLDDLGRYAYSCGMSQ